MFDLIFFQYHTIVVCVQFTTPLDLYYNVYILLAFHFSFVVFLVLFCLFSFFALTNHNFISMRTVKYKSSLNLRGLIVFSHFVVLCFYLFFVFISIVTSIGFIHLHMTGLTFVLFSLFAMSVQLFVFNI